LPEKLRFNFSHVVSISLFKSVFTGRQGMLAMISPLTEQSEMAGNADKSGISDVLQVTE